ncbi:hypothetical protein ACLOJK_017841 [Asimina triloba]
MGACRNLLLANICLIAHTYNCRLLNPLVFGDYPEVMRKNAGSRLPSFTKSESRRVKGSFDFIGVNHYITGYAQDDPDGPRRKIRDFNVDMDNESSGQILPMGMPAAPFGLQGLLEYLKDHYGNPPVYIHENGKGLPYNETLNDTARVEYISGYINATLNAIRNGANVKGYIVWSFLDVFEFLSGYLQRYGLYHVDFEDEALTRQPKLSARWYSNLLKKKNEARIRKIGQQSNNDGLPKLHRSNYRWGTHPPDAWLRCVGNRPLLLLSMIASDPLVEMIQQLH